MKWILILTIVQGMSHGAPSIATAEFGGERACIKAKQLWLEQVRGFDSDTRRQALCVPSEVQADTKR